MGIVYVRMRHTVAFIFFFSEKVGWLLGKVMELLTRGESGTCHSSGSKYMDSFCIIF